MELLKTLLAAGVLSAAVSLLTTLLQRKWSKEDKKDAVIIRLKSIEDKLDKHISENERENIDNKRMRILRFNDEIRQGARHSEEHFAECLSDIDDYEDYCRSHPEYPNNKAVAAIKHIKDVYDHCMRENLFL